MLLNSECIVHVHAHVQIDVHVHHWNKLTPRERENARDVPRALLCQLFSPIQLFGG